MKSSLVILTFNEIEGIKNLFGRIPFDKFDECFVIDNHSSDGTVEFLKEKGMKIIFQDKPGRGEAFRLPGSGQLFRRNGSLARRAAFGHSQSGH